MLRSKRNKLLNYMKDKSDYLEKITGIKLYQDFDYDFIKNLPYKAIKGIVDSNKLLEPIGDSYICPQCILDNNTYGPLGDCDKCHYGINHGYCDYEDSTYVKIINSLQCDIIEEIIEENIILYFKWNN